MVITQMDPRGRVLVLAESTSENMGIEQFCATKLAPILLTRLMLGSLLVWWREFGLRRTARFPCFHWCSPRGQGPGRRGSIWVMTMAGLLSEVHANNEHRVRGPVAGVLRDVEVRLERSTEYRTRRTATESPCCRCTAPPLRGVVFDQVCVISLAAGSLGSRPRGRERQAGRSTPSSVQFESSLEYHASSSLNEFVSRRFRTTSVRPASSKGSGRSGRARLPRILTGSSRSSLSQANVISSDSSRRTLSGVSRGSRIHSLSTSFEPDANGVVRDVIRHDLRRDDGLIVSSAVVVSCDSVVSHDHAAELRRMPSGPGACSHCAAQHLDHHHGDLPEPTGPRTTRTRASEAMNRPRVGRRRVVQVHAITCPPARSPCRT